MHNFAGLIALLLLVSFMGFFLWRGTRVKPSRNRHDVWMDTDAGSSSHHSGSDGHSGGH